MANKSILLVDDEQLIRASLSRELTGEPSGFEVTAAACGEEAIARLHERGWHLVITDLFMPGLDGFQVLKEAKRIDPHTMVIILTGHADMESVIDALRLGADDFLQKPCEIDELLCRISNCFVKRDLLIKVHLYEHILPVCCYCKKIRDDRQGVRDRNQWYSLEQYFAKVRGVSVTHGCCPECSARMMAEIDTFRGAQRSMPDCNKRK
ncbi:response regulator [Desulfobulbus elongatus]|uniref:response regulator n=1 Tax=Desulfobulbus elongatus TaxID=53332 RepID=UPI0006867373|nr:response regulator [Desulfobulbus elongatus]